jgi:hypothetical protein
MCEELRGYRRHAHGQRHILSRLVELSPELSCMSVFMLEESIRDVGAPAARGTMTFPITTPLVQTVVDTKPANEIKRKQDP